MASPYSGLPARNFWKTGVSEQHPLTINDIYRKRFAILPGMKIATAGSCFAQHIATHMRTHGFTVIDEEPAPPGLTAQIAKTYGYGLFSARYANIYTARQLLQTAKEAFGLYTPENAVWERDGRFFDAMRPSVEPNGLAAPEAVAMHRQRHLERVRSVLRAADIFVFTFGLTEAWVHKDSGTVYPTAPGTIAGSYDPAVHEFKNYAFSEILEDFTRFRRLVKKHNPGVKFLITVSPVPLTATASSSHVLLATTYSKSVLRAVAGQLYETFDDVDYFPSYELVASPFSRGCFFEANLRAVNQGGVEAVMRVFFAEHGSARAAPEAAAEGRKQVSARRAKRQRREDVVCEDELLEAFSQ